MKVHVCVIRARLYAQLLFRNGEYVIQAKDSPGNYDWLYNTGCAAGRNCCFACGNSPLFYQGLLCERHSFTKHTLADGKSQVLQ
jgi:hypothetical protein